VKTQSKSFSVLLILAVLIASFFPIKVEANSNQNGQFQEEIDTAIIQGFDYITGQLNGDGGIRWIDESSSVAATIRVVQALSAGGFPQDYIISNAGNSPIDYLSTKGWDWVNQTETETRDFSVARAGQLLTAIAAANKNPHDFGDDPSDFIYDLNTNYDQNTGIYGKADADNVIDQVWSLIGLASNNASVPAEAADWLASVQAEDGSWNDGFGSFLDTTPLAVMALIASNHYDVNAPSVQSALDFIIENQQENGGWQTLWDTTTNPNTTGVMLQAITSLGQFPSEDNWQKSGGNPLTALLSIQQENGVFGGDFGNAYSTSDAIIGLTGRNVTSLGFVEGASEAFDYLFEIQGSNGGWGNVGQTLDVMMALRAAGWHPNSVTSDDASPLDYVSENLLPYIESGPDAIGKSILGITAAGLNPRDFNGVDLGSKMMETYEETTQAFGSSENTWHQALGILGLYSAEVEIPQGAVETLADLQMEDGGWEYLTDLGTSPDSTALAVQALLASGYSKEDQVITIALDYLHNTQTEDGGWGDSSTTSFVIMALNALDQTSDMWIADSGKEPVFSLITYQKANGAFVYSWDFPDDSVMSTASSMLALFGGDFLIPIRDLPNENYAAIVVDPGDGAAQSACVSLNEQSLSGFDLLEASGFDSETDQDGFMTSLLDISNQDGETNYWSYWYWDGREWQFQSTGAANTAVLPGTVEAWHFTSWENYPSFPSEFIPDINEICGKDILADFGQKRYIDYNDLLPIALQKPVAVETSSEEPTEVMTNEPITEPTPAETTEPAKEEDESVQSTPLSAQDQRDDLEQTGSQLAIILIAIIGVITLIILTLLYMKRHK